MDPLKDPLTINLQRQTQALHSILGPDSAYSTLLGETKSRADLLLALSRLLLVPPLTNTVERLFRPILLDLCARWLHDDENIEEKFVALALLVQPHGELFPILLAFLRQPYFQNGPLTFLDDAASVNEVDSGRLHRVLLAYYRIITTNPALPGRLFWPIHQLATLFQAPHPDTSVRYLAVRCYALQTSMCEADREDLESQCIGGVGEVDCQLGYGEELDGSREEVDGWLLPLLEAQRVAGSRELIADEQQDYFSLGESEVYPPIESHELSPYIVNVHGVLLYRGLNRDSTASSLVPTPTTIQALRTLALYVSLRVPVLLTSPPSSGKSMLLSHLAGLLYPDVDSQIITIHLADTSLDARSLLGSYVSSPTKPGTFEWKEGVLVRAMREGKWVVFEDADRASNEVLGVIKPLVESLGPGNWVGACATLHIPSRGQIVASERFAVFGTRSLLPSRTGTFPKPAFFAAHKFSEVVVESPSAVELQMIVDARFSRLAGAAAHGIISLWQAVKGLGSAASSRDVGLRELEKLCARVDSLLPSAYQPMAIDVESSEPVPLSTLFQSPAIREEIYLEARDVFLGSGALTTAARAHFSAVAALIADQLGLTQDRREWVINGRTVDFDIEKDVNGRTRAVLAGRVRLPARLVKEIAPPATRPFAMHKPAINLLARIAVAVSLNEPLLLTGETGTGKTSVITHLASLLRKPLISLNLSHQTESSDLIGGFKPVDARVPGSALQQQFLELFGSTFSRKRNAAFEESVEKAVAQSKWKRAIVLWNEAIRLARERIQSKRTEEQSQNEVLDSSMPRKRRKVDLPALTGLEDAWKAFESDVQGFEVQHIKSQGKFAFGFVEGPLVKALRSGDWILLDEVNLASPETLESISSLLHGPTASITLTEHGSLEPVPRHPDFRLFACMNPATDVGKKDLPPNIRSRFTELDVPPPDADKETLVSIVSQYIGHCAVGDKAAIMNVAEFYAAVKELAESRQIADGSNHRPHYSMRTLARALTFTADMASVLSLRRALWEGCLMAFTMILDAPSAELVTVLAQKHILSGVRNPRSLLSREPSAPNSSGTGYVKFGPFYLRKGALPEAAITDYVMTPSVEKKLIDLARIISVGRFPVLIEGPTSAGKTSSIEYLARRTGHRFVRINNHEHTDIQEYIGTYVSDQHTGKLIFKDGLLVSALRNGDWIVLDELNLAPTDVLEALNRLLDDNRELFIPETQEVVKPHPHFMLFATQNPPGLYAGRKVLSRAFRNRFLEVHFDDVPQAELETILCQRCQIAPSYGQRIVRVFRELQKQRQTSRVFESKQGFATLRDLFRWAGRAAVGYQELAEDGYMLLAERTRREDDKLVVKKIIEDVMKVQIDESAMYELRSRPDPRSAEYLGCPVPHHSQLVWTSAIRRLYVLLARAARFREPVLLVGETGSGKTSVCQVYADTAAKELYSLNCHQNTETADLIGGLRPLRNRASMERDVLNTASDLLASFNVSDPITDLEALRSLLDRLSSSVSLSQDQRASLQELRLRLNRVSAIFEWHDGPLVQAMHDGSVFLLDEISLADDSVLERLNSVLEPSRTLVLAERGGHDQEQLFIRAKDGFALVATMNPGGDYGKKELSPALRNRFTEIWVPAVDKRPDLEMIVENSWAHEHLKAYTSRLLDFVEWLSDEVGDRALTNLRDILAWTLFSNSVYRPEDPDTLPLDEIFHHAAHMTFLDGLGSLPQLATFSTEAVRTLRSKALLKLRSLVPLVSGDLAHVPTHHAGHAMQMGSFAIPRGPRAPAMHLFNFQAPTTRDNALRVVRACQVAKPMLLEGSPGVGKTALVTALANIAGYRLCRINLSDQTDLIDLFGSDLPVEGGGPGEFAWRDAEFLTALQEGHWVLLDEMNLAPQAVLEGLNAVLDHRGTVYIPELGRSFRRHPAFRIFAAQNPLQQGGGRKGLPKSFINRFTKVYVEELTADDMLIVCQYLFPDYPADVLRGMIRFNAMLSEEVTVKRTFGRQGAPWEFNLRDVVRWASLLRSPMAIQHPGEHLNQIYLQRFRTTEDRMQALRLFEDAFSMSGEQLLRRPHLSVSARHLLIGRSWITRGSIAEASNRSCITQEQLPSLEALACSAANGWLTIVTGPLASGKSSLVRTMAFLTGNALREITVTNATDTTDIIGSFEQADISGRVAELARRATQLADAGARCPSDTPSPLSSLCNTLRASLARPSSWSQTLGIVDSVLETLRGHEGDALEEVAGLQYIAQTLLSSPEESGRFEWVDGPLVRALKEGHWFLMDDANLCNPSVLDRLNSLCEPDGTLVLHERGHVDGAVQVLAPHPQFRLFMIVDPRHGELSRAMRNRGIELHLPSVCAAEDQRRLCDRLRLPGSISLTGFETLRRGLTTQHLTRDRTVYRPAPASLIEHDSRSLVLLERMSSMLLVEDEGPEVLNAAFCYLASTTPVSCIPHLRRLILSQRSPWHDQVSQFLAHLQEETTTGLLGEARATYSHSWGVPSASLLAQPIDFFLNSPPHQSGGLELAEGSLHQVVLCVLNLLVELYGYGFGRETKVTTDLTRPAARGRLPPSGTESWKKEAALLVKSIAVLGSEIYGRCRSSCSLEFSSDSELISRLLAFGRHLRQTTEAATIDYSSLQVIVEWMVETLRQGGPVFDGVSDLATRLEATISLSAGQGLTALWSGLSIYRVPDPQILRLETLARSQVDGVVQDDTLRLRVLQLMALRSLPDLIRTKVPDGLDDITNEIATRLVARLESPNTHGQASENAMMLLFELQSMDDWANMEHQAIDKIDVLLDLASKDQQSGLARFVHYQQLIWAIDAGKALVPVSMLALSQWLKAIWSISRSEKEPIFLFSCVQLQTTVSRCAWSQTSLSSFSRYERALHLHAKLLAPSRFAATRSTQLAAMLLRSMFMIVRCFPEALAPNHLQLLEDLSCDTNLGSQYSFERATTLLDCIKPGHFMRVACDQTISHAFKRVASTYQRADFGAAWIGLARFILCLYVPDRPVDPLAADRCAQAFWQSEETSLTSRKRLHLELERQTTGNLGNCVLDELSLTAARVRGHLDEYSNTHNHQRTDVARVHAFWAETSQFLEHVVSPSKIDSLVRSIRCQDDAADMREQVIQESIDGFCQRLDAAYQDFNDLSAPIHLALLHLRLGLATTRASVISVNAQNQRLEQLASQIVAFPSIRGVESLRLHLATGDLPGLPALSEILIALAAVLEDVSIVPHRTMRLDSIERSYDQALRLWLIDSAHKDESEDASNSLYRRKSLDHDALTESQIEEQEFLELFPTFEDLFQDNAPTHGTSRGPSTLTDPTQVRRLAEIHRRLFRLTCSEPIVETHMGPQEQIPLQLLLQAGQPLSDSLDEESLACQLALIHRQLSSLTGSGGHSFAPYDFYFDANVPEIRKAAAVVQVLRDRVFALVQEWPDQMVLQHLLQRCDSVLSLNLDSSIAKTLVGLEQLLLQSEDWEMYSNRQNTLKAHQQALIDMIISWRRLELSCWERLLQVQSSAFADQTSEWWFRLYDACVRAPGVAAQQESGLDNVARYLEELVPLLNDFITSSPIGQFQRRIELLQSFEVLLLHLASSRDGVLQEGLGRVNRIIRSTWMFFAQFSSRITRTFQDQKAALDKDVRNFIKLASWKDVNVHALKASATRTHHQLYKTIRKFREVMRQPITDHLGFRPLDDLDAQSTQSSSNLLTMLSSETLTAPALLQTSYGGTADHLINLPRTFHKFNSLVDERVRVLVSESSERLVEDLAVDIILGAKRLASVVIAVDLPAAKRESQQKSLLMRKRKAWNDLLKELKRTGLSASVKPEILNQQRNVRWIREQASLPDDGGCLRRAEEYFCRLEAALPDLREAPAQHHGDLSTRELQKAVIFVESGYAMALESRSCTADAFDQRSKLERHLRRLHAISSVPHIAGSGSDVLKRALGIEELAFKLAHALGELIQAFGIARDLGFPPPTILEEEARARYQSHQELSSQLKEVVDHCQMTHSPVLLKSEYDVLAVALTAFSSLEDHLRKWLEEGPTFAYLLRPFLTWFEPRRLALRLEPPPEPSHSPADDSDRVINALLVTVQNVQSMPVLSCETENGETQDHFIRDGCRAVCQTTRTLDIALIVGLLDETLPRLAQRSTAMLSDSLNRILPFLDAYSRVVDSQLLSQAQWTKALFKLQFVLCSTALTVARQGFCKPPDAEEGGGQGDGVEVAGGVGLGQGEGAEDVSKEIEDESQVEGLKGEDAEDDGERAAGGDDAIEMDDDVGGQMQDVSEGGSEDGDGSDDESEGEPEEQVGKLDALDPNAVDEKLWGDEEGPREDDNTEQKTDQDQSEQQKGDSEITAKEDSGSKKREKEKEQEQETEKTDDKGVAEDEGDAEEETGNDDAEDASAEEEPSTAGAPMDEHIPDANTLDLPDDLNLGPEEEMQDDLDIDLGEDDNEDMAVDEEEVDSSQLPEVDADREDQADPPAKDAEEEAEDTGENEAAASHELPDETADSEEPDPSQEAVAQPDVQAGENGDTQQGDVLPREQGESASTGHAAGTERASGTVPGDQTGAPEGQRESEDAEMGADWSELAPKEQEAGAADDGSVGAGAAPAQSASQLSNNPLRSLGDSLKEIRQHFEDILGAAEQPSERQPRPSEQADVQQLEYLRHDDADEDMQALGPAGDQEAAKLSELRIVDEGLPPVNEQIPLDIDPPAVPDSTETLPPPSIAHAEPSATSLQPDVEAALTETQVRSHGGAKAADEPVDPSGPKADEELPSSDSNVDDTLVELELRHWQAEGLPEAEAERMWRLYESLTHDLSYALCEQLRLILAPTLATRLRGDYRTGKRLNMRKIIPYIASEYTKDKIWLRRTRPSQREYQVLLALDDSRSMAESRSVHLAFETLALVTKALGRLEVGEVGVAKFGADVEVLHGFDEGPFTDQGGAKVMRAFRFDQKATNVLSLVETSLRVLEAARERRASSSSSAADLWQLEIIISDGICQDHERLRTVLRQAEEQRVMIVFLVLDSLHSAAADTAPGTTSATSHDNSILSMTQVGYKNVDGRMEMQLERYMDSFPFEYYVVLRNVEALPGVLAGTLKQFFERISEE